MVTKLKSGPWREFNMMSRGNSSYYIIIFIPIPPDLALSAQTVPDLLNLRMSPSKGANSRGNGAVTETGPIHHRQGPNFCCIRRRVIQCIIFREFGIFHRDYQIVFSVLYTYC